MFLKRELNERRKRDPNYSLRAFAKFLDIDDGFLSRVINGKRVMSELMLEKVGARLDLDQKALEKLRENLIKKRRYIRRNLKRKLST